MQNRCNKVIPHPQLIEMLFAHKVNVSTIFRDVLGIHKIDHIAITRIDASQQILVFSSTAAIEFSLFTGSLWSFDNTYSSDWFKLCTGASWQSLYQPARYDELYYTKQIKHDFPTGLSMAVFSEGCYYIYSLASKHWEGNAPELLTNHSGDFYKIGQYCANLLQPLFLNIRDCKI